MYHGHHSLRMSTALNVETNIQRVVFRHATTVTNRFVTTVYWLWITLLGQGAFWYCVMTATIGGQGERTLIPEGGLAQILDRILIHLLLRAKMGQHSIKSYQ